MGGILCDWAAQGRGATVTAEAFVGKDTIDHQMTSLIIDSRAGRPISPDLWGVFFEDINYAGDGGLYAEMVQNRSFDYGEADAPGWNALTAWTNSVDGDGDITLTTSERAFARGGTCVVLSAQNGHASIANLGWDGMQLVEGEEYELRVIVRALDGRAGVNVSLEADGQAASETVHSVLAAEWMEVTGRLRSRVATSAGSLVVALEGEGAVAVAFVSLIPAETFGRTANGLRADLAQSIAHLQPRFVRFPGGCVAHGLGLQNVYRWKATLGPVEERQPTFNLWGYHQSMGLGYFEYFQFCEQIGATALPVVAAGVCCQNTVGGPQAIPDDQMDDYIQEVLDLIEWANGTVDSRWGGVRAASGHPEPFGLRYLAIGNEDKQDDIFRDRFRRIHDAVKEAHPEIVLIGTVGPNPFGRDYDDGWAFARELGVEMVDEHSYKSPRWYFENLDRFDGYDRQGPSVYVGEYGSKGNTQLNALAEAAYMMGLERNGDIVRLASYAPLLAKIGHTQWVPDLIYFDNDRVLPTANYWVQQMHAEGKGDSALPVDVSHAPGFIRERPSGSGVSVRSTGGVVELRDVSFDGGPALDTVYRDMGGRTTLPIETDAADYTLRLTARQTEGADGFVIGFGKVDTADYMEWNFGVWRNRSSVLQGTSDGFTDEIVDPVGFSVELDRDYKIEIAVSDDGRSVRCTLDGAVLHEYVDPRRVEKRFTASAVGDAGTGDVVVKIVNATEEAPPVRVELADGAGLQVVSGRSLAARPDVGVAFEAFPYQPGPVTAQETVRGCEITIEPFSFTVLRLRSSDSPA